MKKIIILITSLFILLGCHVEKRYHLRGYNLKGYNFSVNLIKHEKKKQINDLTKKESIESNCIEQHTEKIFYKPVENNDKLVVTNEDLYASSILKDNESNLTSVNFKKNIPTLNVKPEKVHLITKQLFSNNKIFPLFATDQKASFSKNKYENNFIKKKPKQKKDNRKKTFSWPYFWFLTLSTVLTSLFLASPFIAVFILSYLVGFLISISFYRWIKWKRSKLTKSILFQFFYWTVVPQMFIFFGYLIVGLFSLKM
jgi:hypothetical protein